MREGLAPKHPFLLGNGKWKPFIYIYSYEVKEIRSPLAHHNDNGFMATLAVTRHDVQNLIVQSYYCKNQESKLFSRFNIYYGRLTSVRLENSVWKYLAYKLHNFFKVITSMYPTLIFRQQSSVDNINQMMCKQILFSHQLHYFSVTNETNAVCLLISLKTSGNSEMDNAVR